MEQLFVVQVVIFNHGKWHGGYMWRILWIKVIDSTWNVRWRIFFEENDGRLGKMSSDMSCSTFIPYYACNSFVAITCKNCP